ncbi:hypothetical protein M0813_14166 [Anaeramoeba flamelloides]|uniref:Thioredoxin-like fold domain-containing protein n=1 Tax=Anaeramoeba flamelloides TaxID=1746091 RepID=A0ABQ8Z6H9_9EUKA|nr:hypothetical protein M0813_14166 [Anaeramoeba flamelloides]
MNCQKSEEHLLFEVSLALISLKEKYKQEKFFRRIMERTQFVPVNRNSSTNHQNLLDRKVFTKHHNLQRNQEQIKQNKQKPYMGDNSQDQDQEQTKRSQSKKNNQPNKKDSEINFKRITLDKLQEFVLTKPRPPWSSRLECFYRYNPKLIVGWKTGFADTAIHLNSNERSEKVIISKELFPIFSDLTKRNNSKRAFLRVYKSSQRGVEEFFRKVGYEGKRLGPPSAIIMIEMYGDLLCPDCATAWPVVKQVLSEYSKDVVFYFHTFPLPYHTASFHVSQATNVMVNLTNGDLTYFWRYLDDLYLHNVQQNYWNNKIADSTDNEVVDSICKFISDNYPYDYQKLLDGMSNPNRDWDTRVAWKFACAHGVYGTPTFWINGMVTSLGTTSTFEDWKGVIDPLI